MTHMCMIIDTTYWLTLYSFIYLRPSIHNLLDLPLLTSHWCYCLGKNPESQSTLMAKKQLLELILVKLLLVLTTTHVLYRSFELEVLTYPILYVDLRVNSFA